MREAFTSEKVGDVWHVGWAPSLVRERCGVNPHALRPAIVVE